MITLKELLRFLKKGKHETIFKHLDGLDYLAFAKTLLEGLFLRNPKFAVTFWHSYIGKHRYFKEIFSAKYAVDFLKFYLKKESYQNLDLLNRIAVLNPEALVKSFRITQAFINDTHFQSVSFFQNASNELFQRHYKAFDVLRKKEQQLFSKARSSKFVDQLNPVQWLFIIFLHYEFKKRERKKRKELVFEHEVDNFKLIQSYNALLSYSIKNQPSGFDNGFRPKDIVRECSNLLNKDDFLKNIWDYFAVLENWRLWYLFVHDCLDAYCYDPNYDVAETTEGIRFCPVDPYEKAQRLASSIATSIFYSKWDENAKQLVPEFLNLFLKNEKNFLKEPKKVIGGAMLSFNLAKASLLSFFYGLDSVNSLNLHVLLMIISGSMANAPVSYGKIIQNINSKDDREWLMEILQLMASGDPDKFPIQTMKWQDWDARCRKMLDDKNNDFHLLLLLNPEKEMKREFDRFNSFVNLWQKPYLKFGDTICYIKTLLSDMDPAVVALEAVLNAPALKRSKVQKSETDLQETRFAEIFKGYGFEHVHGQFNIVELVKGEKVTVGEVDILVYDGDEMLIIEIKRSKLRLTPKEQRQEQYEVLTYATERLQKIIKHVKAHTDCLTDACNISAKQVKAANISGCVLNMYHHLDGTKLAENIYKTSFVSLFHHLKQCRASPDNKVTTFIRSASQSFIPSEVMNLKPGQYDFVISDN